MSREATRTLVMLRRTHSEKAVVNLAGTFLDQIGGDWGGLPGQVRTGRRDDIRAPHGWQSGAALMCRNMGRCLHAAIVEWEVADLVRSLELVAKIVSRAYCKSFTGIALHRDRHHYED
jgi:hypothetical protein